MKEAGCGCRDGDDIVTQVVYGCALWRRRKVREAFCRHQKQRRTSYLLEEVDAFNRMAEEILLEDEVGEERNSDSEGEML